MKLKSKKERREQIFAPQKLANGRVLSLDAPQSLTLQSLTPQGLNPTRAFSVAEAMIALLIGTIILGFSAPMITKQLKHNDFTSIQTQIMNKKIENVKDISDANAGKISDIIGTKTPSDYAIYVQGLENQIKNMQTSMTTLLQKNYDKDISSINSKLTANTSTVNSLKTTVGNIDSDLSALETDVSAIEENVSEIEEDIKNLMPTGAVMYFDLAVCPKGWTALSSKYPKAANAFIRNQSGSGRDIGNWQQNAAPNIKGTFGGINHGNNGPFTMNNGVGGVRTGGYMNNYTTFDASLASKVYGRNNATEIRPDNIVLLACRKN